MAHSGWRLAWLGLLLIVVAVGISGGRLAVPGGVAVAQATEAFTQTTPDKVYSGIPTHTGPAEAEILKNGYCVGLQFDGHPAAGTNNGFSVSNGVIVSTDFFDNGSATTADDTYCVVVTADRLLTMPRPDMVVRWTYQDAATTTTIALNIRVVTVVLKGTPGVIGGAAQACTEGWDPTFLTGETSNTPPALPAPLDIVALADWTLNPLTVPPANVRKIGQLRQGNEWCLNITADQATVGIDVTLDFYAMYTLVTVADDTPISEVGTDIITITGADRPELRHISPNDGTPAGGQILKEQLSTPSVIGSTHTACVIPSVAADTMLPTDINFQSSNGATASGVFVFHRAANGDPQGVVDGTLCFGWTSVRPGLQTITARVSTSNTNPTNIGGPNPRLDTVTFSSNDPDPAKRNAPLIKPWNTIDRTVISRGGDFTTNLVTNTTINVGMGFDISTGGFQVGQGISFTEWVLGSRPAPNGATGEPIDGVPLTLKITSACGYFRLQNTAPDITRKTLTATTIQGRYPFTVDIDGDGFCRPGTTIRIEITAKYPDAVSTPQKISLETLDIVLSFRPPEFSPTVAWLGTTVPLTFPYIINPTQQTPCEDFTITYRRSKGQPGTFSGFATDAGSDFVVTHPDPDTCEVELFYESEDPGEVDIVITVEGVPFSKVVIPIFFIAFEDVQLTVPSTLTVSQRGDLDGDVRGWFPGTNLSGRPAEVKNGIALPKDRWVLPDDWGKLKGPDDFRPAWTTTADIPPARLTFFMENEGRVNKYQTKVSDGVAGNFLPDDLIDFTFEDVFNLHPDSKVPSILGSDSRPRIMTTANSFDGFFSVDVFGDHNLSYEGCAVNVPTGNPHCKPGDIAGRGRYFALAEYPEARNRGKWLPATSNTVSTAFTWEGYKTVTWEDGADPLEKYVVAHLKDRDGFCNAISFNNTLGVIVDFKIDGGGGIIVAANDRPSTINSDTKKFAVATSFDTENDLGAAMNATLVRTVVENDECQAWIKISNSLLSPTDVFVTFAAPPSPVPGNVRITGLVCGGDGPVTVKNMGTNPVSLAGFAMRSSNPSSVLNPEEHLGLYGYLQPGESKTFLGNPGVEPWINSSSIVFGNVGADYAALVWEETTISIAFCDASRPILNPPLPQFTPDGEGIIQVSVTVPYGAESKLVLSPGWNLISIGTANGSISVARAIGDNLGKLEAVYSWNPETGEWLRFVAGAPDFVNTLDKFEAGKTYWVQTKESFTLTVPKQ